MMIEQLNKIIHNLMNAKDLLAECEPNNPDIHSLTKENQYRIDQLEIYSRQLVENISLTKKIAT
jgi:hypothetical protein